MVKKLLVTLALVGAAASITAMGTLATFTSSTAATTSNLTTGQVQIALGAVGPANRLTLGATGLLPGDTMTRAFDLSNTAAGGSDPLASVSLTTTAGTSSLLNTDASNGLQMKIDRCSVAWTESGVSPAFTYTCGGTTSAVLASAPVIGANLALSNLTSLTTGNTDHLLVTLTFPASAPQAGFQSITSTITYTFTGTQRAATSK
jgi:hypothetical protein